MGHFLHLIMGKYRYSILLWAHQQSIAAILGSTLMVPAEEFAQRVVIGMTLHQSASVSLCVMSVTMMRRVRSCCLLCFITPAVECPALQNPANGRVNLSSVTFGSIATYECNVGYILVGDLQRTCQDNGQWSGRQPECIGRSCKIEFPWTSSNRE